jgi:hypothetical protein
MEMVMTLFVDVARVALMFDVDALLLLLLLLFTVDQTAV